MFVESAAVFRRDFTAALDDDLNAPRGLAALFGFAREGNRLLDEGRVPGKQALDALALADAVLDVMPAAASRLEVGAGAAAGGGALPETPPSAADSPARDAWALAWAARRREAKLARNYAEADRIRELLRAAGYDVRDGRSGVEIVRLAV
jgi:cysteinyl-tRNA synthetase